MFCDNKECELNRRENNDRGVIRVSVSDIGVGYLEKDVKNHEYTNELRPSLYFCDTCHAAIIMVRSR